MLASKEYGNGWCAWIDPTGVTRLCKGGWDDRMREGMECNLVRDQRVELGYKAKRERKCVHKKTAPWVDAVRCFQNGGRWGTRTLDLLGVNQLL